METEWEEKSRTEFRLFSSFFFPAAFYERLCHTQITFCNSFKDVLGSFLWV